METTQTAPVDTTPTEPVQVPETNVEQSTTAPPEAPQAPETPPSDTTAPEPTPEPTEAPTALKLGVDYNGVEIPLEVSSEVQELIKSSGLNVESLVAEAMGDGLSKESLDKLYSKHGKLFVDTLVDSMRAKVELTALRVQADATAQERVIQDLVGGADKWNALTEFAAKNASEAEIEGFNFAMDSGNLQLQKLVVEAMHHRMEGKAGLDLITTGTLSASNTVMSCTREEYIKAVTSGKYDENPSMWDRARQNSIARGM